MSDFNQLVVVDVNDCHQTISLPDDLVEVTDVIDGNDSEYEDIEDEHEVSQIEEELRSTAIVEKSPVKTTVDDEENQHVPSVHPEEKPKQVTTDENDKRNPTYVPRKGKFYEHDDRTAKEDRSAEQRLSRNHQRFDQDSNDKWQHDLYLRDQPARKLKFPFAQPSPKSNETTHRLEPGSQSTPRKPTNNHDDKNAPKRNYDRFHSDDWRKDSNHRQIVHPKRNFTNRQFQQTERRTVQESSINRNEPRQLATSSMNSHDQDNDLQRHSATRQRNARFEQSARVEQRHPMQKQDPKSVDASVKAYPKITHMEGPKRYSSMRHGFSSPSSRNVHEQSDWLQTPQSPLSSYFSQQKFPPSPTSRHYPQVSRYFPMNDSQTSVTRDVPDNQ